MKKRSKAQFWRDMANEFEAAGRDGPPIQARKLPNGDWILTGGTEASREEFKRLASIAGRANQGHFPDDVND